MCCRGCLVRSIIPLFSVAAIVVFLPFIWRYVYEWKTTNEDFFIETVKWSDRTQNIIDRRHANSQQMQQIAIALVAGVWGLLIIGKEKVDRLADGWHERISIICATGLLVLSCYYSLKYTDLLISEEFRAETTTGKIPNLLVPLYAQWFNAQLLSLIVASLIFAATVVIDLWVLDDRMSDNDETD